MNPVKYRQASELCYHAHNYEAVVKFNKKYMAELLLEDLRRTWNG